MAKRISKSKCAKHTILGPALEVWMSKKLHAATARSRLPSQNCATFGRLEVEKVHTIVARRTFPRPHGEKRVFRPNLKHQTGRKKEKKRKEKKRKEKKRKEKKRKEKKRKEKEKKRKEKKRKEKKRKEKKRKEKKRKEKKRKEKKRKENHHHRNVTVARSRHREALLFVAQPASAPASAEALDTLVFILRSLSLAAAARTSLSWCRIRRFGPLGFNPIPAKNGHDGHESLRNDANFSHCQRI